VKVATVVSKPGARPEAVDVTPTEWVFSEVQLTLASGMYTLSENRRTGALEVRVLNGNLVVMPESGNSLSLAQRQRTPTLAAVITIPEE